MIKGREGEWTSCSRGCQLSTLSCFPNSVLLPETQMKCLESSGHEQEGHSLQNQSTEVEGTRVLRGPQSHHNHSSLPTYKSFTWKGNTQSHNYLCSSYVSLLQHNLTSTYIITKQFLGRKNLRDLLLQQSANKSNRLALSNHSLFQKTLLG